MPTDDRSQAEPDGATVVWELVGERWSLMIIRELLLGARRFSDLRRALPGLSANVLTQRLESLERSRMLRRTVLPSLATVQVYELTDWGYRAEEPILALGRWAAGSSKNRLTSPLSSTAFMLLLKSTMNTVVDSLSGLDVGFRVGGEPFRATIIDGRLDIKRADTAGAPVVFGGEPTALAETFYGLQTLARSQIMGRVAVAGDLATAQAFVALFTVNYGSE